MRRPILIDTDTASDDAVALIMALRSTAVAVKAITVVAGNVSVEQGVRNALYTVELCQADTPVYRGADRPLARELETAHWFHGKDGLGDHGFQPKNDQPQPEPAVDALIRTIREHPGIEVITLGPLTNLALALRRQPGLATQVARCVVMGGAPCTEGNVTPAAEFNIWVDPEAAQRVFRSGLPIEMVGWQLCRGPAAVNQAEMEALARWESPLADFALRANSVAVEAYRKQSGEAGLSLPDPVAMSVLLDPTLCLEASEHYVEIETGSELTRGMTVVDRLHVAADARNQAVWADALQNLRKPSICWKLDVPRWKAMLFDALR